jgi:hypothetical protein
MSLSKAQLWALAGAGLGGLTALPNLFTKDKENRKKAIKSFLLRAGLAGGSAYLLNKGLSNYIANSLMKSPYMYDADKLKLLEPNWHLGKKQGFKDLLSRIFSTPDFDSIAIPGSDPAEMARRELLARHLGVFNDDKGSIYYKMPSIQREILQDEFKDAKNILKNEDLFTLDTSRNISRYLNDLMLTANSRNKSGLNNDPTFGSKGSVYGNYTTFRAPKNTLAAYDIWDYDLHSNEKSDLKKLIKNVFTKTTDPIQRDKDNKQLATLLGRQTLETLFGNPIQVFHKIK